MTELIEGINNVVWGIPTLILILAVGVFLSFRTGFVQITMLPKSLRLFFSRLRTDRQHADGTSSFRALCTALSATVGTGNLAGVAGAICIGGPGAIFWMWICAFFGMVTKYAEATLAVHYRTKNRRGEIVGGPMYMIRNGLGDRWKWLAACYCFMGVVASFGVGNATQINTVIGSINSTIVYFGGAESTYTNLIIGIVFAVLILLMLLGGAKRIGTAAEVLVPFASLLYLILGIGVLVVNRFAIPTAFVAIFEGAFTPKAVTGGVLGSMFQSVRVGASRGVFTNEAGMGTAGIAHASAQVDHPTEQGLMGIMEVFLDTMVICTVTALVIICSGVAIPYGEDEGIWLTIRGFSVIYGEWICIPIMLSLCCFAVATVLGWGLYGVRCAQYLFGEDVWKWFVFLQAGTVVVGAVLQTGTVWMLAEIVNGLMAIPNLIALAKLSPVLFKLTEEYKCLIKFPGGKCKQKS